MTETLAAIKARLEKATMCEPALWRVEEQPRPRPLNDYQRAVTDEARVYSRRHYGVCKPTTDAPHHRRPVAEFVAHAPEDIATLIAMVEVAETALSNLVNVSEEGYCLDCCPTVTRHRKGCPIIEVESALARIRGETP